MVQERYRIKRLDRADFSGFIAFGTGRAHKGDALVFGQAFEALRLNVLEMGKEVASASVRRDEAEAFGIVEPFYGASLSSHFFVLFKCMGKRPERTFDQEEHTKEIKQDRQ